LKRFYWCLGIGLDIIHIPFAIGYMLLGRYWVPIWFWLPTMVAIAIGQVLCLGCPLMVVSSWLKQQRYPDHYYPRISGTAWVYGRFGRLAVIPLFACLFVASGLVVKYYRPI
jgi:hypothetical protein